MKLPALRMNLDFMPSPLPDRPGLLMRDPYRFSDTTLIIPPPLVECLRFFDGEHTDLDLREWLVQRTGQITVGELQQQLMEALSEAGFLHDETYEQLRAARIREFAESPARLASHAGQAYPDEREELAALLTRCLNLEAPPDGAGGELVGIAAPHVSLEGGWRCYQAAYRALGESYAGRTFVILGTSHYGESGKFGLTKKNFATPYGEAVCDAESVDWLANAAPDAVTMEDYCHQVEHSIEFQVIFLQHLFGPSVRILPVLCGSFSRSISEGGLPEDDVAVRSFLDALRERAAGKGKDWFFVLGIDLAHMGHRYGDPYPAEANRGPMVEVAARDRERLACVEAWDKAGFWRLVQQNHDDLKWCGAAPLYTLMSVLPQASGRLLRYEQWNIDDQSVVSFAGMAFV